MDLTKPPNEYCFGGYSNTFAIPTNDMSDVRWIKKVFYFLFWHVQSCAYVPKTAVFGEYFPQCLTPILNSVSDKRFCRLAVSPDDKSTYSRL